MQIVFLGSRFWRKCFAIGLLLLVFLLVRWGWHLNLQASSVEEIVARALANLERAYSYRYTLSVVSIIDGKETLVTQVEGIWNRPDRFYIKGEAFSTPLEAYIIGDQYIVRDLQGGWIRFQGEPSLVRETVLFAESPLSDLQRLHSLKIIEERIVGGQRCYLVEGSLASVSNRLWQAFWQDFTCRLWIDKREIRLRRLDLYGSSIGSDDRLIATIEIHDYDGNLVIKPPDGDGR